MLGVWVNAAAVILGGLLGTFLRGGIPDRFRNTVQNGLSLCVLTIGVAGAIKSPDTLAVIVAVVLGAIAGEALKIEDKLDKLGDFAQKRLSHADGGFSEGFVSATLLFCVGAMAVVGSLEAGLQNKPDTLLAKSALDGVSSVIFASTLGPGVILSVVPLTIYQGGIALLAGTLEPILSDQAVAGMSAVGGVLIMALGFNMLGFSKTRIKVGNLLPAILIPLVYYPAYQFFSGLF